MALIRTVEPGTAEGQTKEIYDTMQKVAGMVPAPLQLASASPWMLEMAWRSIQHYSRHPRMGFGVLSAIRYLVARHCGFAFCTGFNKKFLMMQGMSEADIEKMEEDPLKAPLDDKDRALAGFVMKAIQAPEAVEKPDVDRLHDLGWTDGDVIEAVAHGTNMVASSILMKAFKMDQTC